MTTDYERVVKDPPSLGDTTARIYIVQVNTEDIRGGAAMAAYRLFTGLEAFDQKVRMLVKYKKSTNTNVIVVSSNDEDREYERELFSHFIHQECIDNNRTPVSTTLFSYPIFGFDFEYSKLLENADIINLHWINFFCSLSSLAQIAGMKKPVVWTLHDEWLLTGGCHYPSGCENYLEECKQCPQLADDARSLPQYYHERKRHLVREMNPVIVTPSRWLAEIVRRVDAFRDMRIEVIPNSIDTALYTDIPKETARKRLNLPPGGFYILFSVSNACEKRKGIRHLAAALGYCMEDRVFSGKVVAGEIKLVCFGDPGTWTNEMQIPLISLGRIESEEDLCTAYSAADVFLVPSIEDNLPNIVMEAMSCGTPTIAFDTGGIPEMIQNGVNGYILKKGSESDYAKAIVELAGDPERSAEMSKNCRTIAVDKFSLEVQVKRYLALYDSLLPADGRKINRISLARGHPGTELLPDASDINTRIMRHFPMQVIAMEMKIVLRRSRRLLTTLWEKKRLIRGMK